MNERHGTQSKYTLSFRIVSVSFPPASSPTTSLISCIFGCTRTHTQHTFVFIIYVMLFIYLCLFAFFFVFEDHGNKHRDRERQWQRAKNERRVTTATIDVRKATDGIDDGSGDVNLTERKSRTHTQRRTRVTDQESVRERSQQTLVHVIKVTRAAHERFRRSTQIWAPPLYKKLWE